MNAIFPGEYADRYSFPANEVKILTTRDAPSPRACTCFVQGSGTAARQASITTQNGAGRRWTGSSLAGRRSTREQKSTATLGYPVISRLQRI